MNTTKSMEELFTIFLKKAESVGLDITLHPTVEMYFESLDTQGAWMLWGRAYWLGVEDADKQHYGEKK